MSETQHFEGRCHCGAVQFSANADLSNVISCNCSICSKHGLILTFVPADQFTLEAGEDTLKDYQFNTMRIRHRFCGNCGVEPFAEGAMPDGTPMRAINVRCLDGVDVSALSPTPFDGRSR
ncbi:MULTISPECIES: GFA family protein [unclassified Chelatococcus]|uniref:GFA family protein n=1 Tax=unclassified Chelatococcus TaxID=2638111 RepID=UPI001BD17683|nr:MULTISPECIES: GFA family protein [unclassified Chelatococcus]MBS7698498.1 GFA family protein [Chelatococcus sp. YT9]MBX3554851.1 GFA family protein [Chelatococcus sp.]